MLLGRHGKKASAPKVRTGCKTCRKRRIKCDEEHPSCQRCLKSGRDCEGYDVLSPRVPKPPKRPQKAQAIHQLLPKTNAGYGLIPASLAAGLVFDNERERSYFRLFQDEISNELSGGFESTLWSQIVLQACVDDSIRHLTIATAALKLQNWNYKIMVNDDAKAHLKCALSYYGKALKTIRKSVESGIYDLRTTLIAALLIFCVENMHGNNWKAISHIESALGLIPSQFYPNRHAGTVFLGANDVQPDLETGSGIVEAELLKPFITLDRSAIQTFSPTPSPRTSILTSQFHLDRDRLPDSFSSIQEARNMERRMGVRYKMPGTDDEVTHHGLFFGHIASILEPILPIGKRSVRPALALGSVFSHAAEHPSTPCILQRIDQWRHAYESFLGKAEMKPGDFVPAMTLYIPCLATYVALRGYCPAASYDPLAEIRKILDIIKEASAHFQFSKSFVFEIGLIPPLWLTIVLCPDIDLKREAVAVLRDMEPRIECVWDSRKVADDGEAFIDSLQGE